MANPTFIGLLAVALLCCGKPSSSQLPAREPIRLNAISGAGVMVPDGEAQESVRDESDLTVHVIDNDRVRFTATGCTGIPARQVTVEIDGVVAGKLEIPCSMVFRAPAKSFPVTKILAHGTHSIRVIDTATGHSASSTVVLPMLVEAVDENDEPAGWLDMGTHVISYVDDKSVSVEAPSTGPFMRM